MATAVGRAWTLQDSGNGRGDMLPAEFFVSTVSQLRSAVDSANAQGGNARIILADGDYLIAEDTTLAITAPNITMESDSGDYTTCRIIGEGKLLTATIGIPIQLSGSNFLLRNLAVGQTSNHGVQMLGSATNAIFRGCRFFDIYEQFIKANTPTANFANTLVEGCLFEHTTPVTDGYTNGIDAHDSTGWTVRKNIFRNFAAPAGGGPSGTTVAEWAIHLWKNSANCLVEKNIIIDCDRGIGFGLYNDPTSTLDDGHACQNNSISHADNGNPGADVGISVASSNTTVYNNTVYGEHAYPNAIEVDGETDTLVTNNLTNKTIAARFGGSFTDTTNETGAQASWFTDFLNGDLTLVTTQPTAVDVGTTLPSVPDDIQDESRPIGPAYDIGSDEYGGSVLSLPLVQSTDPIFVFDGTWNLPAFAAGDGVYGGGFNVSEDGQFMYLNSFNSKIGKITIPALGGTGVEQYSDRVTGLSVQDDLTNKMNCVEYNGELYRSVYADYAQFSQPPSEWIHKGDLNAQNMSTPQLSSGATLVRAMAMGLMRVPPEWQTLLGGDLATTGNRISIIANAQNGYGFATFDSADVDGVGDVPLTPLLDYPYGVNALEPADSSAPGYGSWPKNSEGGTDLFSGTTAAFTEFLIVPGSRSLLFITAHGYGPSATGTPGSCREFSSTNAEPFRVQVVAYDLRDLVDVKNGVIPNAYDPQPYAWWEWQAAYGAGGVHWTNCVGDFPMSHQWGAYSEANGKFYMSADVGSLTMYQWTVNGL